MAPAPDRCEGRVMRSVLPILTVLCVIVAIWYAGAVWMNSAWTLAQAAGLV